MSPRLTVPLLALCVIDQLDGPVALVELPDGALRTVPLLCLPPGPVEGERLGCQPAPTTPCEWIFSRLPSRQDPLGGASPNT